MAYLKQVKPIFESEARILVQRNDVLGQKSSARNEEFLATQAEIMSSPNTVERALKAVPELAVRQLGLEPVSRVLRSLAVRPISGTNVLSIGIRQTDPKLATDLIDAIIASYADYVRELEQNENSDSVRMLAVPRKPI